MTSAEKKQRLYLDIAKATKADIEKWKRGVLIENRSGVTIDSLLLKACTFRFRLASLFLAQAKKELRKSDPSFRVVLGRSYYAMYHFARSVVYQVHKGDDHEKHSDLPKHLPDDFPDKADWQNKLREARLERNRADYDPFPLSDASYKGSAKKIAKYAEELAKVSRSYLFTKGVAP